MKRSIPFIFALFFASAVALSCSQAAPRIDSASLRLTYRPGGIERLTFFVLAEDEDGTLDLEELHLLNDRAQLYWSLSSKDWIIMEKTGETWIGSHSIAMPDDEAFPRGTYRVVLIDKGGERAERTISFDPPLVSERPFPSISVSDGRYRVVSSYPKNTVVAYDSSGALAKTITVKTKQGPLSDFDLGPTVKSIALWAEDDGVRVAALTDPVSLKGLY